MTDNGACYRSRFFADALGDAKHRRIRAYRPQTNGKVEVDYPRWLHHYNHHRPHSGISGDVPAARVRNLTGNYR